MPQIHDGGRLVRFGAYSGQAAVGGIYKKAVAELAVLAARLHPTSLRSFLTTSPMSESGSPRATYLPTLLSVWRKARGPILANDYHPCYARRGKARRSRIQNQGADSRLDALNTHSSKGDAKDACAWLGTAELVDLDIRDWSVVPMI